ncbi:hypothetical protein EBZ39_15385 [bacterium]|nr:hypothetical protein [bacterium]
MAKKGDVVYVDAKVFVASRVPSGVLVKCEVLEDSGPSQTYITKATGGGGSPLYVFNNELKEAVDG